MKRYAAVAAVLIGCGGGAETPATAPPTVTPVPPPPTSTVVPTLSRTLVLNGLSNPWDLAFAPDSTLLYTERCRGLTAKRADGTAVRLFGTAGSVVVASDLVCEGQSGMLGVVIDPAFATNGWVYVYMSSNRSTNPRTNRVIRLQTDARFSTVLSRTDIVTDIPYKDVGNAHGGAGVHSGGRIRFGPDGLLYVTTGDNHDGSLPQSPTRLGGKVLRLTRDGTAAAGNSAPAGFDARVFTYGHRNVQGISFRPGTGQPFIAEHGPNHSDEVTPLVAGGNGGWDPQNRPALNCASNYCGYAGNSATMPMTDRTRFPAALEPSWRNNAASQGLGPATFLSGTQWKAWNGRLAVGVMAGQRVEILELDAAGLAVGNSNAGLPSTRYRSLVQGVDGALWVLTDSGELWRVIPQ